MSPGPCAPKHAFSRLNAVVLLALGVLSVGCAHWKPDKGSRGNLLPSPKLSPSSVVLEVVQIQFDNKEDKLLKSAWGDLEEPLDVDVRRHMEHNGFWCGVSGLQIPPGLRKKLDEPSSDLPDQEGKMAAKAQRLQCRRGDRKPWVCLPGQAELNVLLRDDDGTLRGRTYFQARCMMGIRCFPNGDGSVRIQIVPEVEHGDTKPRHYGDGGLWQVRVGQERESFDRLMTELTITPGQTIVLSCTPDKKGIGGRFFSSENGRSALLLRLAQTQLDDLFEPTAAATISDLR